MGAQGTVCAGGRYDTLVEQLGGKPCYGVGFAIGLERLVLLVDAMHAPEPVKPHAYFALLGDGLQEKGMAVAERLRTALPGLRLAMHCGGGGFKSQFKRADKSGARFALIMGEDEWAAGTIALKFLREDRPQQTVTIEQLIEFLTPFLTESV